MIKSCMLKKTITALCTALVAFSLVSCAPKTDESAKPNPSQKQADLEKLLHESDITDESRFTAISHIANGFVAEGNHTDLVLFLTDYVEKHPEDRYNAYWLLMVAYSYMENGGTPIARYYFDRILNNYEDLLVKDTSVHFTCLTNLIKINESPDSRIGYFTQLVSRFPDKISLTEMYARLAVEYEKLGEWEQMLMCYKMFKAQPDATTIQIAGIPNAYNTARQMVDFNASAKDWSFETLEGLEKAVKDAIAARNYRQLERYKSKANFFAMSWRQEETDANSQTSFPLTGLMDGRVRYSESLDETSNPTEAYLRTWGWRQYVSVWYFYFRKINFPLDPEVHGRWEWAGIYFGEKL